MSRFAVRYEYAPGAEGVRGRLRADHTAFLHALHERGRIAASGPLQGDSGSGALIIVHADSGAGALALLDDDPFLGAGAILRRAVDDWTVVFGSVGAEVSAR